MKPHRAFLISACVVLLDQVLKAWVKTSFRLGEEIQVWSDWFRLHFTENYGMAFGLELGGETGKVILTNFRLAAVIFIIWYLVRMCRRNAHPGFIVSVSLILAGAMGNIIDSIFYGMFFSASTYTAAASWVPPGEGYAGLMHGRVVDMFYFPVLEGYLPGWFPAWGGQYFIFFRPVFNLADASITTGVFSIFLFQKTFMRREKLSVLALCTGNSARSQMMEGYLRHLGRGRVEACSAGVDPKGLHPLAVHVMAEEGIDISRQESKHADSLQDKKFDYVITVCDNAKENCPYIPARIKNIHHAFEDPAAAQGTENEMLEVFRRVREEIKKYCESLLEEMK